jgi:hypothetical protein
MNELLWNEPSDKIGGWEPSGRENGHFFGKTALATFLDANRLKMLVRSGEFISNGFWTKWDNRLTSLWSVSGSISGVPCIGAIMHADEDGSFQFQIHDTSAQIQRDKRAEKLPIFNYLV